MLTSTLETIEQENTGLFNEVAEVVSLILDSHWPDAYMLHGKAISKFRNLPSRKKVTVTH